MVIFSFPLLLLLSTILVIVTEGLAETRHVSSVVPFTWRGSPRLAFVEEDEDDEEEWD
jgi:hypothetical protein